MSEALGGPASWREAQSETLAALRELRRLLAHPDEVRLLTAIHATCGLCERSSLEKDEAVARGGAEEGVIKCDYCPAFDQFGGCRAVNRRMTDYVLEKDWSGLEALVDDFIDKVSALELPPEEAPGGGRPAAKPPEGRGPGEKGSG